MQDIRRVAGFRSKARLPALTWMHPVHHTTITRSSQPLVGVGGAECIEDERLLQQIRAAGMPVVEERPFIIADCRPKVNAVVRGGRAHAQSRRAGAWVRVGGAQCGVGWVG